MKLPPKAKTNVRDGFKSLTELSAGQVVHFCMVRVGGETDQAVRVVFGPRSAAATKETFFRTWGDDDEVKDSARPKWFVVRGAVTLRADKVTVVPAIRGNRMLAAAELKAELKDLRTSLADSGLPTAPLKKAIDGKFARAEDTTKLVSSNAPPPADDESEEEDDEKDLKSVKGAKEAHVKLLVERYKKIGLKAAMAKMAAADDAPSRKAANADLTAVRDALVDAIEEAAKLDRGLRAKTLGSTRFKESLTTLAELTTRAQQALKTVEPALGNQIGRAELAAEKGNTDDRIIDVLRGLVTKLNAAPEDGKIAALVDLYFAADTWLKIAGEGSAKRIRSEKVDLTMKPKVKELYGKAAKQLAERANVTINNLPSWLERNYGKGMTAHGFKLDVDEGLAKWMTADQREVFRLHVKGGKLYQYNWWTWSEAELWGTDGRVDLTKKKLVLADSAASENKAVIKAGYSGYVMSMSGDLYLSKHVAAGGGAPAASVYHSSYMAGLPVLLAGEILIKAGAVKRVNTNSGHYAPPFAMISRFLKQMETLGVKVEEVADHSDTPRTVEAYLALHANGGPDAAANEALEVVNARHNQQMQLVRMLEPENDAIQEAGRRVSRLELAIGEVRAFRLREVEGRAHPRGKGTESRLSGEVSLARKQAADQVAEVQKAIARLEKRLADRAKNHAALKTKDQVELAEAADGYVTHVTKTLTDARDAVTRLQAAVADAAAP